ncbi:DHH family phosphoesterase [Vibrio fluvialis]|uniref:DHH family phosphoesterase n=1 Tax=Vibrio fluvialis TaxID=676 RepID=UPI001302554A|nr:DHH family phosphoesterase [Vibrio fluvialis]EKO3396591.1 DHH family phosphoesterase [Vibrio fluvialis]EKO3515305.1 DHH family phosphoesterase [Vibrio fluvialis]EKO3542235.1 DHH family phosphoesterase [Vibrio fluvialis]EKO3911144.1 DHH family phosphoesterase [Vibrio fluvialis]ELO1781042.1 DHH family phosphoesterase [Vibrio fluvialis]
MHYDIFNGDADGIIALLQLRLAKPRDSQLITGVKRDIELLANVTAQRGDSLTVLDISMAKNRDALLTVLASGAQVFYADHHQAGDIPQHEQLDAHINLDANMCTALIVDTLLEGRFHHWAITAAYGDNLLSVADALAAKAGLRPEQAEQLKELGTLINYNGYGQSVSDLHYHPADLFRALLGYSSPFEVIADPTSPYAVLKQAYEQDIAQALAKPAVYESKTLRVFALADEAASHRVSGVYGNLLANQKPDQAHVVLTVADDESYTVSLRAPLNKKRGAGTLCSQFATGGGREAAAGINRLPKQDLARLIASVEAYYA